MDHKNFQKKEEKEKDNLSERQLLELNRLTSKRQEQLAKEEPKKKLETIDKKSITKIVSLTNKSYESFNVDIIDNKDPQVQLHQSKRINQGFSYWRIK